jgi:hypothetical protein
MTLPDPHLPLNPGHVLDDPPQDEAQTAEGSEGAATGEGSDPEG